MKTFCYNFSKFTKICCSYFSIRIYRKMYIWIFLVCYRNYYWLSRYI